MKSVVVEASTVAKAIESAWLKAGKPEEYFIRVLQEHASGFLGFGAVKAKIVLFFKNSHKSDSLFPVVLKQKEYTSFFKNFNLKVPAELDVVDHETNKNVSLGSNQSKKKPHNNQNNQQKSKQNNPQSDVRPRPIHEQNAKAMVHPAPKLANSADRALQNQGVKQIKIQHPVKPQQAFVKAAPQSDEVVTHVTKNSQPVKAHQPKMQVSLQAPEKDDVVKNIAKVLKKVQTQKIVANVSRPIEKTKTITPKFENYSDFINSTTGIPVVKEKLVEVPQKVAVVEPKVETLQSLYASIESLESHAKNIVVVDKKESIAPVISVEKAPVAQTPRVPLKMKRRPLTTENPGVSGITRSTTSSQPVKTVEDVQVDSSVNEKE